MDSLYQRIIRRRVVVTIFIIIFSCLILLLLATGLVLSPGSSPLDRWRLPPFRSVHETSSSPSICTPDAFASGHWRRKKLDVRPLSDASQIMNASGFQGCAKKSEDALQLGLNWDDDEEHESLLLPWRGNVSAYDWVPGCDAYNKPEPTDIVRQLVEDGGWLLLGDSISEGHFFTISCILYPHVRADPEYPWDRDAKMYLYLSPTSTLVTQLNYPKGFDIDTTPLVTYQRVDLLLGKATLEALYLNRSTDPPRDLFSQELVWAPDPDVYLPHFLATFPYNYQALILNTGGHWVTSLFNGFWTDNESEGHGLVQLLDFFSDAMDLLLDKISVALDEEASSRPKQRQVVIRAYNPGHPDCHDADVLLGGPVDPYPEDNLKPFWNWWWIRKYNDVFKDRVSKLGHSKIHFLSLDPIGRSRPDAHVTKDCLHVLTGSGVPETWTQYISYFISNSS